MTEVTSFEVVPDGPAGSGPISSMGTNIADGNPSPHKVLSGPDDPKWAEIRNKIEQRVDSDNHLKEQDLFDKDPDQSGAYLIPKRNTDGSLIAVRSSV